MPWEAVLGMLIVVLAIALIAVGSALAVGGIRRRATQPRSARARIVGGLVMTVVGVLLLAG